MVRLGYRRTHTQLFPAQIVALEQTIAEGFARCKPQGCWMRLNIVEHRKETVVLEDGTVLVSASLADLLCRSTAVALMAATAGANIVRATTEASLREDGVKAVIFDAVGGQTAEAAVSWIDDLIRQQLRRRGENLTKHRFSPGYGDLGLGTQRDIHRLLKLSGLGVSLTSGCMLVPEKSVTALAGIEQTNPAEGMK